MASGPAVTDDGDDGRGFDAGWLFLIAGLALLVAAILIPPNDDLGRLRYQRDRLAARETHAIEQLRAYNIFLEALDEADPDLVRRLAAAELNLVPSSAEPVAMVGRRLDARIDAWIQATLPPMVEPSPPMVRQSRLRQMCTGRDRLWTIAAGATLVLIGLLPPESKTKEAGTRGASGSRRVGREDEAPAAVDAPALQSGSHA